MRSRSSRKARLIEPQQLLIEKLSHEGRGISHFEGKVVFVDQALPGEQVVAKFSNMRGNYGEALTEEVIVASPQRTEPPCRHFAVCGGCSLQHMNSQAQIDFKEGVVHEKLSHHVGEQDYQRFPPITGPVSGYRRKGRLGVRFVGKKQRVLVGFRERQTNYLADMDSCEVLDPKVSSLIPALSELILGMDSKTTIPQIEVAVGDTLPDCPSCALIIRHLAPLSSADLDALVVFAQQYATDIYLQPKGPATVHKLYPQESEPRLYYEHPAFGLRYAFHPLDFTQVNAEVNVQMVSRAIELLELESTDRVLDLFCGLGNFTLPLALKSAQATGVEVVQMMVERGMENAQRNNIDNAVFISADLTRPPEEHEWLQQGFDKVLLDPPRSGALEVLPAVIAAAPKRIVYVSCNPATLARDAEFLAEHGYKLAGAGAMDMFPHTSHVEAMALFLPDGKRK